MPSSGYHLATEMNAVLRLRKVRFFFNFDLANKLQELHNQRPRQPATLGLGQHSSFSRRAVLAVYIEGLVALVELAVEGIEDQAIGTELRLGHSIVADVELVALHFIGELAICLGALKVGGGNGCRGEKGTKRYSLSQLVFPLSLSWCNWWPQSHTKV